MGSECDHELAAAVLVILADHGIGPDFGEVLLSGNPLRSIRPGALYAAIAAIRADQVERDAKVAEEAADHEGPFTEYFKGRDQGCHDAAAAIRQKGSDHAG